MLEDTITDGLAELGLPYEAETPRRFRQYYTLLTEANAVMNLTAIHGETETARLHFLDSLAPLLRFSLDGASLIDVGTGAGFPGVPLKLLCPSLSLTLLDAQRKRVDFLRRVNEDHAVKLPGDVVVVSEMFRLGRCLLVSHLRPAPAAD